MIPENNALHKKCLNKNAPPAPEGLTGEAMASHSKIARVGNPTKQDLLNELNEAKGTQNHDTASQPSTQKHPEMIKKLAGEKRKLKEMVATTEAEQAKTKETELRITVPKKKKNQKGPAHCMGDIVKLLEKMPEVEDAKEYYSSAQVG